MKYLWLVLVLYYIPMIIEAKPVNVRYMLGMSKPSTHYFEVEMALEQLPGNEAHLDFMLPVWRSGRYLVLDLASGIQEFSAEGKDGKPLSWNKTDKSTWRVGAKGQTQVTVRYKVYANEFNLRTRGLNDEHGFVDGSAVFMYVEKYRKLPLIVQVKPFGSWRVTTGLESVAGKPNDFQAESYDVLVDSPLEIGLQKDFEFDIDGVPHVLSMAGEGNWNADTLIKDITVLVRAIRDMWGAIPYKRFVFIVHCNPSAGGGTEHLNSVVMGARPFIFKNPELYRSFLGLVSHEYFHTWNVKQLRPKGMVPYNYQKENYTQELWIAEGTTSYYDNLFLVRTGYQSPQKYIDDFANEINNDRMRPGNKIQSVVESSFDAWVKFWRGTQQSYNSESDYYTKGGHLSLLLDLEIRQRSSNASSLDGVLRAMFEKYPLKGAGYTIEDFQTTVETFAGSSFSEFFQKYIFGTEPLPWEQTLSYAGLELVKKDTTAKTWIGCSVSESNGRTMITQVTAGSPAYEAGVDINDELVAMNGYRIRSVDFNDRIKELNIGDTVTLTVLRNDKLRTISVTLQTAPTQSYKITKMKNPTALQTAMYESWLGKKWDETK